MSHELGMIIIGGPGRSGTTYMAAALGQHPEIATFDRIELKFLFERDGLADLGWTLCESFSPNRAWVAVARFRQLINQLRNGGFDQPLLAGPGVYHGAEQAMARFFARVAPDGIAQPMVWPDYRRAARRFFNDIAALARTETPGATHFLEKTPHNLLFPGGITDFVSAQTYCLHLVRDPRATAVSLMAQSWGPSTLHAAIAWVRSYYKQWFVVRDTYDGMLPLMELRIEEIVADPGTWEHSILEWLTLPYSPVFAEADAKVLQGGLESLGGEDRRALDAGLGDLAERLGYPVRLEQARPACIGPDEIGTWLG